MKEVEKKVESMINDLFEIEFVKAGDDGIDLSQGIEINFPKLIKARPAPDEVEHYEELVEYFYKESCSRITKLQFRKLFNTIVNAESLFLQLAGEYYSPKEAEKIHPGVGEATKLYLRVLTRMIDNQEDMDTYYEQINSIREVRRVLAHILNQGYSNPADVCLAFLVQDLLQGYQLCISEQRLRTDFHSQAHFTANMGLLSDRVTEVLCKLNRLYKSD